MNSSSRIWNRYMIILGILPGILVFIAITLIPSVTTAVLSFTNISGIPGAEWEFIGFDNYREFFVMQNSRDTVMYFKNTFKFAFFVTVIQMTLSLLIALLLNSRHIYRKLAIFARAAVFASGTWSNIGRPCMDCRVKSYGRSHERFFGVVRN